MNRKILLAVIGFLVFLLAAGLANYSYAETSTVASAGDAVATAQTSPNPPAVPEGVTANAPADTSGASGQVTDNEYRPPTTFFVPTREVYVIKSPVAVVAAYPVRVTNYRRLYATPIRDALFGRYRTTVAPAWYPLRR